VDTRYETESELDQLQTLLDTSLAGSTTHLQSIIVPGQNTFTARELVSVITSMCTLAIATVTAKGEPRISGIDGHFWHGRWIFGTARRAAKARHLAARPGVSVAHLRGEEFGVFTHGKAEILHPDDGSEHPDWPEILRYLTKHYGESSWDWGDVVYYRLNPHWMVTYGDPKKLLAEK